jgi:hypothetical protein
MPDISLRLPYLIYLSIASILIGVLIAPLFRDIPVQDRTAEMLAHDAHHGTLEVAAEGAPEVAISVEKDQMSGWNVAVTTGNFTFTPERVNSENIDNTGHGHLYVNGMKIARLYGSYFHIPDLPPGEHEISVSLSSNDHSYYTINGKRIAAQVTVKQDVMEMDAQ